MVIYEYMEMLGYNEIPDILKKYLLSPSLLRLKKIGYFCGMDYASKSVYNFSEKISRYDHSLTVALITWRFTKDIKATLAGLFHDISTPCFSHVIDYMNKDYDKQESTEEKTEEIIRKDTYLLSCLKEDNISVEEIINFKDYSIVDMERPMLCADRLDGVILTGLFWTENININDVRKIIDDLMVVSNEDNRNELALKNKEVAELVLETSELIDRYCHSREDNYMMELLAMITKRALDLAIITYDELFILDEEEVMRRFKLCNDIELIYNLNLFMNIDSEDIPLIEMPQVKIRVLNPLVGHNRLK